MNFLLSRFFWLLVCLSFIISFTMLPLSDNFANSKMPYQTNNVKYNSQNNDLTTEIRGVWLTNVSSGVYYIPGAIDRAINQLSSLNFNTIYPVVWNRGYTFYQSSLMKNIIGRESETLLSLLNKNQREPDFFAKLVKLAKAKNISVIPWFEYGLMIPPNSTIAKQHPEWLTLGQEGLNSVAENLLENIINGSVNQSWLNPLHPEVQNFITQLILEVVKNYDVDGIQLDDHFSMPVELGYDPFTIQLYQQEHQGKKPPKNHLDPEWMRWRANKLTMFMGKIFESVKAVKPNLQISLSPNSQYFAYKYYLQDWLTWINNGFIDQLILQVYKQDMASFIREISQPAVKLAKGKIPVAVGISTGLLFKPVDIPTIKKQIEIIRKEKFLGVSFFYWESLWGYITPESPYQRRQFFQEVFNTKAVKPLQINLKFKLQFQQVKNHD